MQLTNETLEQTVELLTNLVQMTEVSPVEQNTGNLNDIASTLANVANFVDEADVEVNETVSQWFKKTTC